MALDAIEKITKRREGLVATYVNDIVREALKKSDNPDFL